jgi:hypothetical protein
MSVHAVVPIENPRIRTRPRMVPSAIDRSRKISGAAEMIHLTVLMAHALQQFAPNLVGETQRCLIQINPRPWHGAAYGAVHDLGQSSFRT